MIVCIRAKCGSSGKTFANNFLKDLERSIRLVDIT
jgi:hypothetical protein